MKRLTLLLLFVGATCLEVEAQSWLQMLQNLFGGSSKSEEVATPKFITASQLQGEWFFSTSEIEYEGDDALASMGVSALKGRASDLLGRVGVVAGRDKIVIRSGNRATLQIGEHRSEGNYTYDAKTGKLAFSGELAGKNYTLEGSTEYQEGKLKLLFNAHKVMTILKDVEPALTEHEYVKIADQLFTSYPGIQVGATFQK